MADKDKVVQLDMAKAKTKQEEEKHPIVIVPVGFLAAAIVVVDDPDPKKNSDQVQSKMVKFVEEFIKPESEIRKKIISFSEELSKLTPDVKFLLAPVAPVALEGQPANVILDYMKQVGPAIGIHVHDMSQEGANEGSEE